MTTTVRWRSSNSSAATISNIAGSRGNAIATAAGTTTISATSGKVRGSTTLTVTPAPIHCTGSLTLLNGGPPPVYTYTWSCDQATTDFTITLTPDRTFLNASIPVDYACAPESANGGTNNQLHCNRSSGTTSAGQSVTGQVETNQPLATNSIQLTVSPQSATFAFTGP
jgi:hypothetical protein